MRPLFPPFDVKNVQAVNKRLKEMLPPNHFLAYELVTETGQQAGCQALLVGGIVRDLLLGYPNLDLDFVTLGYSLPLAEAVNEVFRNHPAIRDTKLVKHIPFGTARLYLYFHDGDHMYVDFATSRRETYAHPGALPTVDINPPADLKEDLKRRDYTLNAMALSPESGLVDPYGGLEDLRDGWLRKLHPGSFRDDPTRMARGVRFAARLTYRFEPDTELELKEIIAEKLFAVLTPERKRHEWRLMLAEEAPERSMQLLHDLGLLVQFQHDLRWDCEVQADFARIKGSAPSFQAYLSAFCRPLNPVQAEHLAGLLCGSKDEARVPVQVSQLRHEVLPQVSADLSNSRLYSLLHGFEREALEITALLDSDAAQVIYYYLEKVANRKPVLGGDYLKELGLKPGKEFRAMLDSLRDAVLDGKLEGREAEAAFLRHLAGL